AVRRSHSPTDRFLFHVETYHTRRAGVADLDGHLPLGFRARGSEVVQNLAGRAEPRGIRETISPRERRLGTLLDDGDLLETAGSLMRRGLIDEDLAFDTFMDAPPWGKVERIIGDRRKREKAPAEGENFEWIAARARIWVKQREASIRKANVSRRTRE